MRRLLGSVPAFPQSPDPLGEQEHQLARYSTEVRRWMDDFTAMLDGLFDREGAALAATTVPVAAKGDLLYGNAVPEWAVLPTAGVQHRLLEVGAGPDFLPAWTASELTIEADSWINQDLTTDAGPTFHHIHANYVHLTGPPAAVDDGLHLGYIGGATGSAIISYKYSAVPAYLAMTYDALSHIWDVSGTAKASLVSAGLGIASGLKLFLDGVAGTGDTYLVETAPGNILDIYVGGTKAQSITIVAGKTVITF